MKEVGELLRALQDRMRLFTEVVEGLKSIEGVSAPKHTAKGKRRLSTAGRKRIAAAQKKRWARFHKAKGKK